MLTVLAGGVGASRFLQGLASVVNESEITVISNTADDVEMFGLHVQPDVDIVMYALAGAVNPETGWGLEGDTLNVVQALQRYGYPGWFNLGDRDLATAIHRTRLKRDGWQLHEIVEDIAAAWGLGVTMLPMSNEPIATRIVGPDGEIAFQDYMVRLKTGLEVRDVRFDGVEQARPAPGVLDAIRGAEAVIVAPSNPFVSVGPILAVPGVREALRTTDAVRVAISPIVAGNVVKGPAAQMLQSLGHEVSALAVARLYRDVLDLMVIDEQDRELQPAVEELGLACHVTDTMMVSPERKAALASATLSAARQYAAAQ